MKEKESRKRMRGNGTGENKFENFLENERQLRGRTYTVIYALYVCIACLLGNIVTWLFQYHNSGYKGFFRNTLSFCAKTFS